MDISEEFPPHAPPSLWLLGVPPPSSPSYYWGKIYKFSNPNKVMEVFTNSLTGAAFCEQNGSFDIRKNDSGKVFFVSLSSHPLHRSGYISKDAAEIISKEMAKAKSLGEEGPGWVPKKGDKPAHFSVSKALRHTVSTFLDFAIINYNDDEGKPQECPTLMPKASGETLFSADDGWDD